MQKQPKQVSIRSILNYTDRYFDPVFVVGLSSIVILIGAGLFSVIVWSIAEQQPIFGANPEPDYVCFYVVGKLLNEFPSQLLYNFDLQNKLYHSLLPDIPADQELPFVNPPFFAIVFRPLAYLPFSQSYLLWVIISLLFYLAGLLFMMRACRHIPSSIQPALVLLAFSFPPFLFDNALSGNSSAVGFLSISLTLYNLYRGNMFWAGLLLSVCLYKPTLLVLLVPMILVSRQYRLLCGFCTGAAVLAALSLYIVGLDSSLQYVSTLSSFAEMSAGEEEVFRTWKYVDILSFARLLVGSTISMKWLIVIGGPVIFLLLLIRAWWIADFANEEHRDLIWASTIAFTVVCNVHLAIYDSILIVVSLVTVANFLYRRRTSVSETLLRSYRWLLILVFVSSIFTQHLAINYGIQIYTVFLVCVGVFPLYIFISKCVRNN